MEGGLTRAPSSSHPGHMSADPPDDDTLLWALHEDDLVALALPDGRFDPPEGHPDRRRPEQEPPGLPPWHPDAGGSPPPPGGVREPRKPKPGGGPSAVERDEG
jgi:hypothetical protein